MYQHKVVVDPDRQERNPCCVLGSKPELFPHPWLHPSTQQNLRKSHKWWDTTHKSVMGDSQSQKPQPLHAAAAWLWGGKRTKSSTSIRSLVQWFIIGRRNLQVWRQTQVKTAVGPIKQRIHQRRGKNPQTNMVSAKGETLENHSKKL